MEDMIARGLRDDGPHFKVHHTNGTAGFSELGQGGLGEHHVFEALQAVEDLLHGTLHS